MKNGKLNYCFGLVLLLKPIMMTILMKQPVQQFTFWFIILHHPFSTVVPFSPNNPNPLSPSKEKESKYHF